jgi:hypothetical protein
MGFLPIKTPPEFTEEVEQWTRETDADGVEMAKEIGKLLNNTIYNKSEAERLEHVTLVTLTAAGWTGTAAPYIQTVSVSGAKESMEPILVSALEDGVNEVVQKAYSKAFGLVSSGTASVGDGTATFKVYKKPVTDIVVGLKGV